jgi:hypothetical protein
MDEPQWVTDRTVLCNSNHHPREPQTNSSTQLHLSSNKAHNIYTRFKSIRAVPENGTKEIIDVTDR